MSENWHFYPTVSRFEVLSRVSQDPRVPWGDIHWLSCMSAYGDYERGVISWCPCQGHFILQASSPLIHASIYISKTYRIEGMAAVFIRCIFWAGVSFDWKICGRHSVGCYSPFKWGQGTFTLPLQAERIAYPCLHIGLFLHNTCRFFARWYRALLLTQTSRLRF